MFWPFNWLQKKKSAVKVGSVAPDSGLSRRDSQLVRMGGSSGRLNGPQTTLPRSSAYFEQDDAVVYQTQDVEIPRFKGFNGGESGGAGANGDWAAPEKVDGQVDGGQLEKMDVREARPETPREEAVVSRDEYPTTSLENRHESSSSTGGGSSDDGGGSSGPSSGE